MAEVVSVAVHADHAFSKDVTQTIDLVAGMGVVGDAHFGATVQHRSRVARDPTQPNLRQVHLIHQELLDALRDEGFDVTSGSMGENVTTRGLDLLGLPVGAVLKIGDVLLAVTGLRNPCRQLDGFEDGLMEAVLDRSPDGRLIRKAGVMAVVVAGGSITSGDPIEVAMPPRPWRRLEPV